jgi:hypothetical protein
MLKKEPLAGKAGEHERFHCLPREPSWLMLAAIERSATPHQDDVGSARVESGMAPNADLQMRRCPILAGFSRNCS